MTFHELVRLLEANGFRVVKQKGAIRYYGKAGWPWLIRVDFHATRQVATGTCHVILKAAGSRNHEDRAMIDLPYGLIIEATQDPDYFSFYSPELEGFTGSGCSVEDCLQQARAGMKEHVELLAEQGLPIPPRSSDPVVTIRNEQKQAVA